MKNVEMMRGSKSETDHYFEGLRVDFRRKMGMEEKGGGNDCKKINEFCIKSIKQQIDLLTKLMQGGLIEDVKICQVLWKVLYNKVIKLARIILVGCTKRDYLFIYLKTFV